MIGKGKRIKYLENLMKKLLNKIDLKLQSRMTAFTLAEVLITLGIIGVVAALTLPTLIQNYQAKQYRSQFKKTLSVLSRAVKMAKATSDVDFSNLIEHCNSIKDDNLDNEMTICALMNTTAKGQWYAPDSEIGLYCGSGADGYCYFGAYNDEQLLEMMANLLGSAAFIYQYNDGATVLFADHFSGCTKDSPCYGYIDVNSPRKKPNKETVCDDGYGHTQHASDGYGSGYGSGSETVGLAKTLDSCTVSNKNVGDVFPIIFYDDVVEPATNAATAVLLDQ